MTLLVMDGFDDAINLPKSGLVVGGNSSANAAGRDGSANGALRTAGTSGNPVSVYNLPTPAATVIVGTGWQATGTSGAFYWYTGGNVTIQLQLGINNTTRRWELRTGAGTVLATSPVTAVYTLSTWTHIQAKVVLHATAGSAIIRVNDVEVINHTGQTATTGGACTGVGWFGNPGNASAYVDDMWICDAVDASATQGRPYNDWLGDCKVAALVPTAAGDTTTWTPSTGANWSTLDESPATATDYVEKLASASGSRDLYTLSDLPGAAATVYAVQSRAYAAKADVGTASFKQVLKESGGTVSTVGTHSPAIGLSPHTSSLLTKRPSDGGLWTVANVNAMQLGVEVA